MGESLFLQSMGLFVQTALSTWVPSQIKQDIVDIIKKYRPIRSATSLALSLLGGAGCTVIALLVPGPEQYLSGIFASLLLGHVITLILVGGIGFWGGAAFGHAAAQFIFDALASHEELQFTVDEIKKLILANPQFYTYAKTAEGQLTPEAQAQLNQDAQELKNVFDFRRSQIAKSPKDPNKEALLEAKRGGNIAPVLKLGELEKTGHNFMIQYYAMLGGHEAPAVSNSSSSSSTHENTDDVIIDMPSETITQGSLRWLMRNFNPEGSSYSIRDTKQTEPISSDENARFSSSVGQIIEKERANLQQTQAMIPRGPMHKFSFGQ